ncbi:unnamed protein product [Lasius platythorax]|uniref:Uncharacterized protein n=1 Tax=Lasius platythorax TaxID=488582 RepID=A0AAV2P2M3_9HYME
MNVNWSGTGRPAVPAFPSGIAITSSTSVLHSRRRTPMIVALSQGHVHDSFLTVPKWQLFPKSISTKIRICKVN